MKKKGLTFNCITLMAFCQGFVRKFCLGGSLKVKIAAFVLLACLAGQGVWVSGTMAAEDTALSSAQKAAIVDNCAAIKESLQNTQRSDARTRVYLGRYYETILTDFITPLNLRLVENNISSAGLIENQSGFAAQRTAFMNDYIGYQQGLEELVGMDCKSEPEKFYSKLMRVRELRAKVKKDVTKLRGLVAEQAKLVKELEGKL